MTTRSTDPDEPPETIDIPPVGGVFAEPWSGRKLVGLLSVFGPAAIVASMSIGAGETIVVVVTALGRVTICFGWCC